MTEPEGASPHTSGAPMDLIGKTVRWESPLDDDDEWFTARVVGPSDAVAGAFRAVVVDPGTRFRITDFDDFHLKGVGEPVLLLRGDRITVIDSEPDTDDPECE